MTRTEKLNLIREKYPNYEDVFSQVELENLIQELNDSEKLALFRRKGVTQVLGGEVVAGAGAVKAGAKAAKELMGTIGKRKTAKAKAKQKAKKGSKLKKGAIVTGGGLLGLQGIGAIMNIFSDDTNTPEEALDQTSMDLQTGLIFAQMQAEGIDTDALLATPAGQQLIKTPNFNISSFMGAGTMLPVGSMGVFVGGLPRPERPVAKSPEEARQMAASRLTEPETDIVTMTEWKKQFPISNPVELANWKKKLVDAGVVSASADLTELKRQWEVWGQFSMDANRNGQKLNPFQLLDIQRGLWGGGEGGPSYSTNLIKKQNSRELLKQYMQADTGRIISDEEADEFANLIRRKQLAKPTKTESKMVKGKRVTVTTPGFGESEAVKLAQQQVERDPLFAEFQTANVFGGALEKALGLR